MNNQIINKYLYRRSKFSKNLKNSKLTHGVWAIKLKKFFFIKQAYIDFLKKILKSSKQNFFIKNHIIKIQNKKSLESRMGGGKGNILYKTFIFKPGFFILEYYNLFKYKILYLFKLLSYNKQFNFKFLKKKYI
ncbi:ribosomal protein l16 (apicoplast) [Cystoisospora suis]|uniref:Ribosomal protein l16 n=1 Tax=Cystoisospora suis TaxID=483139 RepID=A0A2C6KMY7_9APIC|nr:ribosomal protein l16 [Cystoisospora suis]